MLSKIEKEYILNNLYCSEQIFAIDSLLLGQPFLENECLVYKKGKFVTIILYPLDMKQYKRNYFLKYWELLASGAIKKIDITGNISLLPEIPRLSSLKSAKAKKIFNNEFILNRNSFTKSALKDYKSSTKKNYTIEYLTNDYFFNSEIQLIWQSFLKSKKKILSPSDYEYYSTFPLFFKNVDIEVITVKRLHKNIGCCFVYHANESKKIILLYIHIQGYRNVNDFVLGNLISKYPSSDFYLGPSTNSGIKKFKQKWATEITLPLYEKSYKGNAL